MKQQGYIYLCRNHRNGYTKIGFSARPSHREKTLQSEEPEVSFIVLLPGDISAERKLHDQFKERRLRGEWFNLSDEDVEAIIDAFPARAEYPDYEEFFCTWHDPENMSLDESPLSVFGFDHQLQ